MIKLMGMKILTILRSFFKKKIGPMFLISDKNTTIILGAVALVATSLFMY